MVKLVNNDRGSRLFRVRGGGNYWEISMYMMVWSYWCLHQLCLDRSINY